MKRILVAFFLSLVLLIQSCQKQTLEPVLPPQSKTTNTNYSSARIDTYPFNWEGADKDLMPTPPGITIGTPWFVGLSDPQGMGFNKLTDRKSADGWELLFNTFNRNVMPQVCYFVLYNKYRGIARFHYYTYANNGNSSNTISNAIIHQLTTAGSPKGALSPILNYSTQAVVDLANPNVTEIAYASSARFSANTWYILEVELAYDKNFTNNVGGYTSSNFYLSWRPRGLATQEFNANGNISGSIDGNIAIPGSNVSLDVGSINLQGKAGTIVVGGAAKESTNILSKLGSAVLSGVSKGITSGVSGIVKNVFSGIFGKNDENNTHLKINATIGLKGDIKSEFAPTPVSMPWPGYPIGVDESAFMPKYQQPLGIFYLSDKPVVTTTSVKATPPRNGDGPASRYRHWTYTINRNSFQLLFNPAITDFATIQNIGYEVVVRQWDVGEILTGSREDINGAIMYASPGSIRIGDYDKTTSTIYVRVSFDVVPKNGSPAVTIVKTFAATIQ